MNAEIEALLKNLRNQPFYKGQILRVHDIKGQAPHSLDIEDALKRTSVQQGGVLYGILSVLGMGELYRSTVAALVRAYSMEEQGTQRDAVLVSAYSTGRELFWQLVCLSDALDFGRMSVILCRNDRQMDNVQAIFDRTLKKAGIQYTLTVARIATQTDFSVFDGDMPMVVLMTPEMLDALLTLPVVRPLKKNILSALGRLVVPCLDEWPGPLASHVAILMRHLHVECAMHGAFPAFVGTMLPAPNAMDFIRAFWGKPIPPSCLVMQDTVESPPMCLVNYGGALLQNPVNRKEWIREPIQDAAVSLLTWLVHADERYSYQGAELHYVLDTSGSMDECLNRVRGEVKRDLDEKLQLKELQTGDQVVLSSFHLECDCRFRSTFEEGNAEDLCGGFGDALDALEAEGGTNIPEALGTALKSALAGSAQSISVVLFSDGQSSVSAAQRAELLTLTRQARSEGRYLGLLYIVLDMDPPTEICNLIEEMGGTIRLGTNASDDKSESLFCIRPASNTVVFLSGEKGLPADVVQTCQAGVRPLVFARSVSDLFDDRNNRHFSPRDVLAVVVSGRYGSLSQILNQVKHLGWEFLPVFVLSEPEAWSQTLCEDYHAGSDLLPSPLVWSQNRYVVEAELARALPPGGTMDADIFAYLLKGSDGYVSMLYRLGLKVGSEFENAAPLLTADELPAGFSLDRKKGFLSVRRAEADDLEGIVQPPTVGGAIKLRSWTQNTVTLRGDVVYLDHVDEMLSGHPLLFHKGAIIDDGKTSLEVDVVPNTGDRKLVARTAFRHVPLIENVSITNLDAGTTSHISDLGTLSFLPIRLEMSSPGYRQYENGNLDDSFSDIRPVSASASRHTIETCAICWTPLSGNAPEQGVEGVRIGLANILRLMAVNVLSGADRKLFVYPDADSSIWIVDLAPGGNGAAHYLFTHLDVFKKMLQVGGQILLECPCEGGFAGASTVETPLEVDTGCPRCARVLGPVIMEASGDDRCKRVSKIGTIAWLVENGHLPAEMASLHVREKYEGIDDASRYKGPSDDGTRRAIMPLVHRILKDRLGLELPRTDWADLRWLPSGDDNVGTYSARDNKLAVQTMLREWMAYSVCAHEVFHNMQARIPGLFDDSLVTADKIDLEGSAVWAESHILDAMAIRTALDMNNLRCGDAYAEGFQKFKQIEAQGGVRAVLEYMKTGILSAVRG